MRTPPLHLLAWSTLVVVLAAVAWIDVRQRRIPNALVAPLALAGLVHAAACGGLDGLLAALVGMAVGVALLYLQCSRGWMGAGDVKLLGAIGAWAGGLGAVAVLLVGSVMGGLLGLVALVRLPGRERAEVAHNVVRFAVAGGLAVPAPAELPRRRGVPFGVALALAAIGVTALGVWR